MSGPVGPFGPAAVFDNRTPDVATPATFKRKNCPEFGRVYLGVKVGIVVIVRILNVFQFWQGGTVGTPNFQNPATHTRRLAVDQAPANRSNTVAITR